jgi:hypothetical protein
LPGKCLQVLTKIDIRPCRMLILKVRYGFVFQQRQPARSARTRSAIQ